MKKLYFSISVVASLLFSSLNANAIPAKPGLIPMTQADGTTINVRLMGDENFHFYLSEDGYLLSNDNNTFYYATVDALGATIRSDYKATAPALRTAEVNQYLSNVSMPTVLKSLENRAEKAVKRTPGVRRMPVDNAPMKAPQGPGLFPGSDFPVTGSPKVVVILVEYADKSMVVSNPHEYFDNMLNQEGFNEYGATGSAIDFFKECSNDEFTPAFDVYGPVTLSHNMAYYGGNDLSGNDLRPADMIVEACQLLDDEVDFSQYDCNGDGKIDNVYVFYAGRGEASGGSDDTIWPHSWNVTYGGFNVLLDGVQLDRYACSNEDEGSRPDGIGTFVHEFSHVMGLPDLYATSYTGAFTPGSWSCMDYGPYNNNGRTPPLYGAFERYALGWIEPLEINGPLSATLKSIGSNKAGIIKTSSDNEFFLLENRQQVSWDKYIPGHGMLIWHIDYMSYIWNSNRVNNSPSHQYVDIEEADGTQSEYTRSGDAFPGTKNVTSFTDDTKPSMKTWGGQALNLPITEIAETDGIITFNVCGGSTSTVLDKVEVLDAVDITDVSFTARWKFKEGSIYRLTVFTRSPEGVIDYILNNKNVGSVGSYEVTGLQPETEYIYTVRMSYGWELGEASEEMTVYTDKTPLNKLSAVALDASDITENSFTARWESLDDATGYELHVYTKQPTGSLHDICDFTDGGPNLPKGWTASSTSTYSMGAYCGESAPSLRLSTDGDKITTPDYNDSLNSLTFWHRGNSTNADDLINIYVKTDEKWTHIKSYAVVNQKGGSTIKIDLSGFNATAARLEFAKQSTGSLAVDDIDVAYGVTLEDTPLPGYEAFATGLVTSHEVKGLAPGTEYYYTVAGKSSTLTSRFSNEVKVKTAGTSQGIESVNADAIKVLVDGRTLMVTGAPDNAKVNVLDLTGRLLVTSVASRPATLGQAGVYIVSIPSKNLNIKIIIK